jgi:hypothetical protein
LVLMRLSLGHAMVGNAAPPWSSAAVLP